jgi:hypothetical protein
MVRRIPELKKCSPHWPASPEQHAGTQTTPWQALPQGQGGRQPASVLD